LETSVAWYLYLSQQRAVRTSTAAPMEGASAELQYLTCCTPPWFHGPTKSRQFFPAKAEKVAQAVPLVTQDQPANEKQLKQDQKYPKVTDNLL